MRDRRYLNDDWKFSPLWQPAMAKANWPETDMEDVRLPHTCREVPLHYFDEGAYQMVSGYRRHVYGEKEWEGKAVYLTLEGAAHESQIYVNGTWAGAHSCGYTACTLEIGRFLHYGKDNVISICLDSRESLNVPPFGHVIDYMTFGGLYRDVYVEVMSPLHMESLFLKPDPGLEKQQGNLATEVVLSDMAPGLALTQFMRKKGEKEETELGTYHPAEGKKTCQMTFPVHRPALWSPQQPSLYEVRTVLKVNGEPVDEQRHVIGFREGVFRADGFYLNGKRLTIRGLNRHQSYPYVGYAMPDAIQKLDADILKKELGLNAVRTSHYPQSQAFLDRCDEIGLLVFTEMPGWQHIGDEKWKAQAVQNTEDMVVQYRNHPSIILWGVRINESLDDDAFYEKTNAVAHSLDPTRPTGGVRVIKKSHLLEDVYTYNDFVHNGKNRGCDPKKKVTPAPDQPYLISEYNGHMFPTKAFDDEEHRMDHAMRHARVLEDVARAAGVAGSFGWCMADYNTHKDFGSGDRICYHGVMDIFRNPKQAAAVYASQQEEQPVLEVSSSMDIGEHPGGNRGEIWVYTNMDQVRMYKNGRLLVTVDKGKSPFHTLAHGPIPIDDFVGESIYQEKNFTRRQARLVKKLLNLVSRKGLTGLPLRAYWTAAQLVLFYGMRMPQAVDLYNRYIGDWGGTATVYRFEGVKKGKVLCEQVKAPMTKVRPRFRVSSLVLTETKGYDVAAIRIQAVDEWGNVLSYFQEPVQLETEGAIALIGPALISLHGGMGGTYVKSMGVPGEGILRLKNSQWGAEELQFSVNIEKQ